VHCGVLGEGSEVHGADRATCTCHHRASFTQFFVYVSCRQYCVQPLQHRWIRPGPVLEYWLFSDTARSRALLSAMLMVAGHRGGSEARVCHAYPKEPMRF
jgi:hypothetical protein